MNRFRLQYYLNYVIHMFSCMPLLCNMQLQENDRIIKINGYSNGRFQNQTFMLHRRNVACVSKQFQRYCEALNYTEQELNDGMTIRTILSEQNFTDIRVVRIYGYY